MTSKNNKLVPWAKSKTDIIEGKVSQLMSANDVFLMRPEYNDYKFVNFRNNLRSLHTSIQNDQDRAVSDNAALEMDLLIQIRDAAPDKPTLWKDSEARKLLKEDIKNGLNENMTPQEMWRSKPEYQMFPLAKFRGHIYQEIRSRKCKSYWTVVKERNL